MQKVETPMGAATYMHSVFREKSHMMQLCIKYTTSPPTVLPEGSWQAAAQVSECYYLGKVTAHMLQYLLLLVVSLLNGRNKKSKKPLMTVLLPVEAMHFSRDAQ